MMQPSRRCLVQACAQPSSCAVAVLILSFDATNRSSQASSPFYRKLCLLQAC